MALSKCAKCDNTLFEAVAAEPRGANYKLIFVQCMRCGAVVGVSEFLNAGSLLNQLQDQVKELQRLVRSLK